jgi:multidrug efflux pump
MTNLRINVSAPFIVRPIATSLLMLGLFLLGAVAYALLPVAALPQVDFPTIQITANLPGANAEIMASSVATPLERALSSVPGITSMTSSSALGTTSITVQFELNRNIDAAAQDVQTAINAAAGLLPKNLPNPPTYHKVNPAEFTILTLAVTSETLPLREVDDYADNYIAKSISRLPGVGLVDFHGEQKPAVRVQIDPSAIVSRGLSLEDIRTALVRATVNAPKGTLDNSWQSVVLDTTDQLFSAAAYEHVIVAYRNGAPIRLSDIGVAIDGVEDIRTGAWSQGRRTVIVDIHKQPGFNVAETVDRIKAVLPTLVKSLPASIVVTVVGDRTQTIRASVRDVRTTLLVAIALVVVVIFIFLRDVRTMIIPAIAIPLSLVGTFAVMYVLGESVDNISLMGLTIAVGFVVDDAIVVMENIVRHVEAGEEPLEAALAGAHEIGFTVISMSTSLIAVFIPLLFMGGVVGRLFREFSVAVTVAITISAVVSLTLTPMMCARLLHAEHGTEHGRLYHLFEWAFEATAGFYARTLRVALAHHRITLGATIATICASVYLYAVTPKGFFPQSDTGLIIATAEAPADVSFPAMAERLQAVARIVTADPDVDNVYSYIEPNPTLSNGRLMINLAPFGQRRATAEEVMARLRPKLATVADISVSMQARQDIQVGGRISKSLYQYTLEDPNVDELNRWAPVLLDRLKLLPQLQDVGTDLQGSAPSIVVTFDRTMMSRFGIDAQLVDDILYDAFGQRQVATVFTQLNEYRVVLEVDPQYRLSSRALARLYVPSPVSGQQVPLSVFAHLESSLAPVVINHQGMFPAVTLSFNLAPGVALGEAVDAIQSVEQQVGMPDTLRANFQGTAQAFQDSLASQPYLIAAAIIVVYIVLGMLYESIIHPITILSTLPSAGLGALLALTMLRYDLSVVAVVGIILLVGIVKKNAIMMVDVALETERGQGRPAQDAIFHACLLRFRPIMMTTMAALLGALPLALGIGAGSELRRPLGIAIVGGLLLSQLMTLYTTPVIYLYVDRLRRPRI